ncbi:hypothetical protein Q5752_003510 [Cryptotrichosporon argae]
MSSGTSSADASHSEVPASSSQHAAKWIQVDWDGTAVSEGTNVLDPAFEIVTNRDISGIKVIRDTLSAAGLSYIPVHAAPHSKGLVASGKLVYDAALDTLVKPRMARRPACAVIDNDVGSLLNVFRESPKTKRIFFARDPDHESLARLKAAQKQSGFSQATSVVTSWDAHDGRK